jgi:hypothetical protein
MEIGSLGIRWIFYSRDGLEAVDTKLILLRFMTKVDEFHQGRYVGLVWVEKNMRPNDPLTQQAFEITFIKDYPSLQNWLRSTITQNSRPAPLFWDQQALIGLLFGFLCRLDLNWVPRKLL